MRMPPSPAMRIVPSLPSEQLKLGNGTSGGARPTLEKQEAAVTHPGRIFPHGIVPFSVLKNP